MSAIVLTWFCILFYDWWVEEDDNDCRSLSHQMWSMETGVRRLQRWVSHKKSSMKFNRTNWRLFWKNTSFLSEALCKVSTSRFFLGGSCDSWVMQRWTSFGTHGSEAFTWRSSVTGCFWGPSWRSSWFPGARLSQPTNLQFADVCCSMMISVWRMWWKTMVLALKRSKSGFLVFGVNGGLVPLGVSCLFFFHDVSTQRKTVEESAARFLPQGSASWRLSHLPLFQRHPDVGNTQKLILVCLQ